MKEYKGNIWDLYPEHWVVIPTNTGWRRDGSNVMGAGLAKQAAQRFPELPMWYGSLCRTLGGFPLVKPMPERRLILFPTKALGSGPPHLAWKQASSLSTVKRSTEQLRAVGRVICEPIAVPLVGCGNGGLDPKDVVPYLRKVLGSEDWFVLVK